jgi:hypothetical protein
MENVTGTSSWDSTAHYRARRVVALHIVVINDKGNYRDRKLDGPVRADTGQSDSSIKMQCLRKSSGISLSGYGAIS